MISTLTRLALSILVLSLGLAPPATAGPILLSVETVTPTVSHGGTALFDIYLRDYDLGTTQGFPVFSFALNLRGSDDLLTANDSDFSRFGFTLDAGLTGIIGGNLFSDTDIGDDGRVEFLADGPPVGSEIGIFTADTRLGQLSLIAPTASGTYSVALFADPADPIFSGGSFLLIDDGSLFGQTAPGDFPLETVAGRFEVTAASAVPEPSSILLFLAGSAMVGSVCWIRRSIATRSE